ncbi:MAG: hypothetical protein Q8M66_01790, partial [Actinomycetota bacterium]|nr:hypothetical protein [Actinomycetota bacterium]
PTQNAALYEIIAFGTSHLKIESYRDSSLFAFLGFADRPSCPGIRCINDAEKKTITRRITFCL